MHNFENKCEKDNACADLMEITINTNYLKLKWFQDV